MLFRSLAAVGAGSLVYRRRLKALEGPDLSRYGGPRPADFDVPADSEGLDRLNTYLTENFIEPAKIKGPRRESLQKKRDMFDEGGRARTDPDVEYRADKIDFNGKGVSGEWVLVKGYDSGRRLLYLHGGGGTVGSALSHRALTTNLAKRTKAAVFAPNYRLMPEHPRRASIEDTRASYRWILENGPDGPSRAKTVAVCGDSAGANLSLTLVNWLSRTKRRQADAVYVLSAPTDSTVSSPSLKENFETDLMLQPLIGPFLKLPRLVLLSGLKKMSGYRPTSPDISYSFALKSAAGRDRKSVV